MKDNFQFSIFPGHAKRPLRLNEARSGAGNFQTISNFKFQISNFRAKRGFTLIELLVVVSIIGVLSTLVLANFNAARERARDAQRKSDLRQVQNALRAYYNDIGSYPAHGTGSFILGCGPRTGRTSCSWGLAWTTDEGQTYMEIMPRDPKSGWTYQYQRINLDSYVLVACLENKSDSSGKAVLSAFCQTQWKYEVRQ